MLPDSDPAAVRSSSPDWQSQTAAPSPLVAISATFTAEPLAETLGLTAAGVGDNFFDLGGHSLLAREGLENA